MLYICKVLNAQAMKTLQGSFLLRHEATVSVPTRAVVPGVTFAMNPSSVKCSEISTYSSKLSSLGIKLSAYFFVNLRESLQFFPQLLPAYFRHLCNLAQQRRVVPQFLLHFRESPWFKESQIFVDPVPIDSTSSRPSSMVSLFLSLTWNLSSF